VAIVSAIVDAAVVGYGETGALCGDALSVPAVVPSACAYVPTDDIFALGDATHGWPCLGFAVHHGIRYSYDYKTSALTAHTAGLPNAPPLSGTAFEVSARADLDGDGELSTYALVAYLQADGSFEAVPYSFQEGE
jgi:hypothetical protein